jgi:hypothetical protein
MIETALNILGMVLFWFWATEAFERDTPYVGYLYIFLSAWNGASLGVRYL